MGHDLEDCFKRDVQLMIPEVGQLFVVDEPPREAASMAGG